MRNGGHVGWEPSMTAASYVVPRLCPGCAQDHFSMRACRSGHRAGSDVVVHLELVRCRPQADRVDLVGALPVDPGGDQVVGEDATGGEELVVGLERLEHGVER